MNNYPEQPQAVNPEPEEKIMELWKIQDYSPIRIKCHNWHISDENSKYIIVNHFQKITLVNMDKFDYISTRPAIK